MINQIDLHASIDKLENLLRQSAELTKGLDGHRQHGLGVRRQVLAQVTEVGQRGDAALGEPDLSDFRREFSKMRSAMAFHQASWPIVAINPEDPAYIASVQSQRDASRHFINWARAKLLKD